MPLITNTVLGRHRAPALPHRYDPPMASGTERPSMAPGDTARRYHRLSSYEYVPGELDPKPVDHPLVRQDFVRNHLPTFPAPFKAYPPGLPRVALQRAWPSPEIGATTV